MFFRGQKGSPVKLEFNIFLEDIKPWTSAQAQSDGAVIPLLLAWRRGSKRSGSTKSAMPETGSDGGKVVFNEGFNLPATLFVRRSGRFQKKSVTFALLEDESAKAAKISRQLATGELDLSQFGDSTEPCSTSIPLRIGLGGVQVEGDPTLSLRVSSTRRLAPSSSTSSGWLSSGGRPDIPQRTSYFLPESDDSDNEEEIDSFTDDEGSRGSPDHEATMSAEAKAAMKREFLFSPHAFPPSKLIYPNPVIARGGPSSTPGRLSDGQISDGQISDGQSSGRSFSAAKVAEETGKKVRGSMKWTEEEKRQILFDLSEPRRSLATAAKTLETAAATAAKSVEAARISMRNSYAERNLDTVAALAENYKAAEVEAAAAIKAVEAAAASLGSSVVAATAVYAARKASLSRSDRPPEVEPPPPRSSVSPPDSGPKLELSESQQGNSVPAPSSEPPNSAEKKAPDSADGQTDYKSLLKEAKTKFAMIERRTLEELRSKVASAVANEEKGKQVARGLEEKLTKREDELRDTAAIEVALYSAAAEHSSSSHKVHTPARRLARLYVFALKNRSAERRASAARNSVLGLVVAVRACGNDVPRLTYWWSNIIVLRESIMQACNVEPAASETYSGGATTSGGDDSFADRARRSQQLRRRSYWQGSISEILGFKSFNNDWQDCNTYVVALLKVETWIHGRILECVWWQAMAPPMQVGGGNTTPRPGALGARFMNVREGLNRFAVKVKDGLGELNRFAGDVKEFFTSRQSSDGNLSQLGDARHGTNSIEVWKNAFTDALERLCPLQGHDAECGCLPVLSRQVSQGITVVSQGLIAGYLQISDAVSYISWKEVIAECVDRLDVAMLNGILRNPEDDAPTDPLADPITDPSVLPIPAGTLTFGAGSQLKNAVVTWSTWLSGLLTMRERNPAESIIKGAAVEHSEQPVEEVERQQRFSYLKATGELLMQLPKDMMDMAMRREAAKKEAEKASPYFVLLRAAGDLLMLPKEMLIDKTVRKEVCPQLKLPLIRRMLCNFVPDEFHPDPVSPALVATINTEVSLEREKLQSEVGMAASEDISVAPMPICIYNPPSSAFVRLWIGEPSGTDEWGKTPTSLLSKGYGSDDELHQFEIPLAWLRESPHTRSTSISGGVDMIVDQSVQSSDESVVYTRRYELLQEVWGTVPANS